MTTPEFERKALAVMQKIPGSSGHVVEVGPDLIGARCIVDGKAYELSIDGRENRDRAFEFVLTGIEQTRQRFANG